MNPLVYLAIAIVSEVIATTALKASNSFTKPLPTVMVVAGYASAFYFLSICLRTISVGVAYAIWSGLGIILVTLLSWAIYGQTVDRAGLVGMGLIIAGVMILNLFSKSMAH